MQWKVTSMDSTINKKISPGWRTRQHILYSGTSAYGMIPAIWVDLLISVYVI